MATGRDQLQEWLDTDTVRERAADLRARADVEALREEASPAALRERADEFYEHAFLPPSYTDDEFGSETAVTGTESVEHGEFDFDGWLEAGRPSGPRTPPEEPRVVTDAAKTPAATTAYEGFDFSEWVGDVDDVSVETVPEPAEAATQEYDGFAFGNWLASSDNQFEPVEVVEPAVDETELLAAEDESVTVDRELPTGPTTPASSFGVHPAKAATLALFLAVAAVAVLSVVGYLPALGPAGGFTAG